MIQKLEDDVKKHEERIIDMELEAEEGAVPRNFSRLYTPKKEVYDKHCVTHIPYRSWCPICVQAKKRNPAHSRVRGERGVPVFSIDYMFLNGKEDLSNPIIVVVESESGGIWVVPVVRKGNYRKYVSGKISEIIEKIGYAKCVLKSDA